MAGYRDSTDVTESNSISREPSFFKGPEEGDDARGNLSSARGDRGNKLANTRGDYGENRENSITSAHGNRDNCHVSAHGNRDTRSISRSSSVFKSSDEDVQYKCDPCSTAGDEADVTGYCTNCEEYLCSECYKNHPRNKASRNHTLLDKNSMPTKEIIYCDPCGLEKIIEEAQGYCKECGDYLCASCYKSHSRNKASRKHTLLDKDSMPKSVKDMTSYFARFVITRDLGQHPLWGRNMMTDNQGIIVRTAGSTPNCIGGGISMMTNSSIFVVRKSYR